MLLRAARKALSVTSTDEPDIAVGSTIRLMPGYAPTTVNHFDCYFVVDGDEVIDVWPVCARYGSDTAGVGPA